MLRAVSSRSAGAFLRISTALLVLNSFFSPAPGLAQLPNTGVQRTIVIVVNFQDNPTFQPWSPAAIQNFYFGSGAGTVNGFFQENSYNQVSITGDVAGYFTCRFPVRRQAVVTS